MICSWTDPKLGRVGGGHHERRQANRVTTNGDGEPRRRVIPSCERGSRGREAGRSALREKARTDGRRPTGAGAQAVARGTEAGAARRCARGGHRAGADRTRCGRTGPGHTPRGPAPADGERQLGSVGTRGARGGSLDGVGSRPGCGRTRVLPDRILRGPQGRTGGSGSRSLGIRDRPASRPARSRGARGGVRPGSGGGRRARPRRGRAPGRGPVHRSVATAAPDAACGPPALRPRARSGAHPASPPSLPARCSAQ